jgi:2-dehydropantoate 2-reductase
MRRIKILVVGCGAVGAYYGGRLSAGGAEVSAVARTGFETIKKQGFRIKSVSGDFLFKPAQVIKNAADYEGKPDFVLVCAKVLPEINIESLIKPVLSAKTSILLIQNGLGLEAKLKNAFPHNHIIGGVAFICVFRAAPGIVHHTDYGRLRIGSWPKDDDRSKALLIRDIFIKGGVNCEISDDIVRTRWEKLIWNIPFNPLSAITGADTAVILGRDSSLKLVRNIMLEVKSIAEKEGYKIAPGLIDKYLADTLQMRPYKTSMLMDMENGRPIERDALLGAVLETAKAHNIRAPYTEILNEILAMIQKAGENK